jgi:hypothetical protein
LRSRPSNVFVSPEVSSTRAHVEQVDEEVVGQRLGPVGEDAVLGLPCWRQDAHAADEHRHLRRGQRQQLRPIDQQFLSGGMTAYLDLR